MVQQVTFLYRDQFPLILRGGGSQENTKTSILDGLNIFLAKTNTCKFVVIYCRYLDAWDLSLAFCMDTHAM